MGVLDRFERRLDRLVNGTFARAFKSEVQPVEIASALQRECDDKAAIVGRGRTIVPNTFRVELGSTRLRTSVGLLATARPGARRRRPRACRRTGLRDRRSGHDRLRAGRRPRDRHVPRRQPGRARTDPRGPATARRPPRDRRANPPDHPRSRRDRARQRERHRDRRPRRLTASRHAPTAPVTDHRRPRFHQRHPGRRRRDRRGRAARRISADASVPSGSSSGTAGSGVRTHPHRSFGWRFSPRSGRSS